MGERLRVLTINVWHKSGDWPARLVALRSAIARLDPHLVALQEILALDGEGEDQAEEIGRPLGYRSVFGEASRIGDSLRFGNAVLSRFPVVAEHRLALPFSGGDQTRALLGVFVATPFGEQPFFVTHLNFKLHHGAVRQRQVAAIAGEINRLVPTSSGPPRLPPILAGDFNAEPDSDEIRFLRGHHAIDGRTVYYADCFRVAGPPAEREAGFTFVPSRNPNAAQTHEPDRRIDYVFVRGPDLFGRGEPVAARVALDQPEDGTWPSDHFGVYAEITAE